MDLSFLQTLTMKEALEAYSIFLTDLKENPVEYNFVI